LFRAGRVAALFQHFSEERLFALPQGTHFDLTSNHAAERCQGAEAERHCFLKLELASQHRPVCEILRTALRQRDSRVAPIDTLRLLAHRLAAEQSPEAEEE